MDLQIPKSHNQNHTSTSFVVQSQPNESNVGTEPQFIGHFQLSEPQPRSPFIQSQAVSVNPLLQNSGIRTNLGVSSPAASTPATSLGSGKRTPSHKPPSRPSGSSSSAHGQGASPLKTMELAPALRRKKRKLSEKQIPVEVAESLAESALYTQMLELESCIDSALSKTKIDAQEFLKNPLHVSKVLRIYVFNTYASQAGGQVSQNTSAGPPSWTLKITGRILEDGIDPADLNSPPKSSYPYPKFSSFFKKITVYLDQNLYPENHVVLWENSRSPALHEGFELKRKGDTEFTAIVRLEMDFVPEKFRLGALQEILGIEAQTRPRVMAALWHYIKSKKLQIPEDASSFMCDPPLRNVFGEEKLKFSAVAQKITNHLTSLKPIHLEHRVRLSGNCPAGNACHDILVDVPVVLEKEIPFFLAGLEKSMDIEAFDESISAAMKKLHEHCQRRDFFIGFSQSPAEFINVLLASQARDLNLLGGDTYRNAEKEKRSEFYSQPWVEDAVIRYLNRKPSVGTEANGSK